MDVGKGHRAPRTPSLVFRQENASQRLERLGFAGATGGSLELRGALFSAAQQPSGCASNSDSGSR